MSARQRDQVCAPGRNGSNRQGNIRVGPLPTPGRTHETRSASVLLVKGPVPKFLWICPRRYALEGDFGLAGSLPSGALYFVRMSRAEGPPKKRTLDGSFTPESGRPRRDCWMSQIDP